MVSELLKMLLSLSAGTMMAIAQSIIAAGSLFLLYKTIKLQNKANETQADILKMEMKAKRAEYMPSIDIVINSNDGNWLPDGVGGTRLVGTKRIVNIQVRVKENPLIALNINYDKPDRYNFKDIPCFIFPNSFYKPGEKIDLDIFEYDLEESKITDIDPAFMVTITYEDMIGNRYEEKIIHNLATNESEQLPVSLSG